MMKQQLSLWRALLIVGGTAYFFALTIVVFVGLGIGTVVLLPLYVLLVPYWILGNRVLRGRSGAFLIGSFAAIVFLLMLSIFFIFRT
jgi:hypothetical protein